MGAALVGLTLVIITTQVHVAGASTAGAGQAVVTPASSVEQVLRLVARSDAIRRVPAGLDPPVTTAVFQPSSNLGEPPVSSGCVISFAQTSTPSCTFGDVHARRTIVLYGDSHAGMWFQALDDIAERTGYKLVVLFKSACPAGELAGRTPGAAGAENAPSQACTQWHRWALTRINEIAPSVLVVSQTISQAPDGSFYAPGEVQAGLAHFLADVHSPETAKVVLGDIPTTGGPVCLAAHTEDVPACSALPPRNYDDAERTAALDAGGRYVDVTPWFCARRCSAVIGDFDVYYNSSHVATPYTRYLENVLAKAVGLGRPPPPATGT